MPHPDPTELEHLRRQVASLEASAADKDARLARLEAQLATVLATRPEADPTTGSHPGTGPHPHPNPGGADDPDRTAPDAVVGRRALLRRGGVAVAAAVAGAGAAGLATAGPAAAANGDPVTLGLANNTQTSPTSIVHSGATGISLFNVTESFLAAGPTMNAAVAGWANTIAKAGVLGYSQNAAGAGVYAYGAQGATGVTATSTAGDGIVGTAAAAGTAGVKGQTTSATALGVAALSTGVGGTALHAVATAGKAIVAQSTNGNALTALASGAAAIPLVASTSNGDLAAKVANNGAGAGLRVDAVSGVAITADTPGAHLLLTPNGTAVPARATAAVAGSVACDANGDLWLCTADGTPGTWRKLAGPATAGALHALAAPKRVFDSRAGYQPANVAKGAFTNQTKVIDAKNNASGVPAGATAVLVNLAVTNTVNGGYGALWANGVPDPGTANLNWSATATSISNTVTTAVDANATFNAKIAGTADVIIDVVGYYR